MATSTVQEDVDKISEDKLITTDGLVHEGELPKFNCDDAVLDMKASDGGVGLDGDADAKASGKELALEGSIEPSKNKKKRKNKNKRKRSNVGLDSESITTAVEIFENENSIDKNIDFSVENITLEADKRRVAGELEKKNELNQGTSDTDVKNDMKDESGLKREGPLEKKSDDLILVHRQDDGKKHEVDESEAQGQSSVETSFLNQTADDSQSNVLNEEHEEDYLNIIGQTKIDLKPENTQRENTGSQEGQGEIQLVAEQREKPVSSENKADPKDHEFSFLSDDESTSAVNIKLQPSVNVIFQSDGTGQIDDRSELLSHFTASETILSQILNAGFGSEFSGQENTDNPPEHSNNGYKSNVSQNIFNPNFDQVGDLSDLTLYLPSASPHLNVDEISLNTTNEDFPAHFLAALDKLEPDDIFNNNYLRCDSQDFENRWAEECYLSDESYDSFHKIPTVPNPSLDNLCVSHNEQRLIHTPQLKQALDTDASNIMNDRVGWKENYPNFVYQAQLALDEILDMASSKIQAILTGEGSIADDEGFENFRYHMRENETKPSDSMNNLYHVEGDLEYTDRYGVYNIDSSETFLETSVDKIGYLSVNGMTFKLERASLQEHNNNIEAESISQKINIDAQSSEGFLVAEGSTRQSEGFTKDKKGHGADDESSQNSFEASSNQPGFVKIISPSGINEDQQVKIENYISGEFISGDEDRFEEGFALPGLANLAAQKFDLKVVVSSQSFQSHVSEEYFDARSDVSTPFRTANNSPRLSKPTELCVEETHDTSFIRKVKYFETEVQKVVLSASKQLIKRPSRTQSENGILDTPSKSNDVKIPFADSGITYDAGGETGNFNKPSKVGTSSLEEFKGPNNFPENDFVVEEDTTGNQDKAGYQKECLEVLKPYYFIDEDAYDYRGVNTSEVYVPRDYDSIPQNLWDKHTMRLPRRVPATPSSPIVDVAFMIENSIPAEKLIEMDQTAKARLAEIEITVPFEALEKEYNRQQEEEQKCPLIKRALPCFTRNPFPPTRSEEDKQGPNENTSKGRMGTMTLRRWRENSLRHFSKKNH